MIRNYSGILFFILTMACPQTSMGQHASQLDSMLSELEQINTDTVKIYMLTRIADELKYINRKKALIYANQALRLSEKTGFQKGLAQSYVKLGQINIIEGNHEEAISFYNKALELFLELKNLKDISDSRYYVASVHEAQGNYHKALKLHFENLKEAEIEEDSFLIAQASWDIGENYRLQQDGVNAEKYFYEAKLLYDVLGHKRGGYKSQYNYALAKDLQGEIEYSLTVISRLFRYSDILDAIDSGNIYNDLGRGLIDLKKYDSAEYYLLSALELRNKVNEPTGLSMTLNELATLYLKQGNYDKSIRYGEQALDVVNGTGKISLLRDITDKLNQAYVKKKDFEKAYQYLKMHYNYIDSIYNVEKAKAVMDIQTQYETEKKDKENLLLVKQAEWDKATIRKQNTITIAIAIVLFLVSIVAFLSYRTSMLRKKASLKIHELNATQTRWFTNIAHELRTPLTLILGPLKNILSQEDQLPSPVASEVELANKNGQQLLKLVNQILDISKMESGQLSLNRQCTSLSILVRHAASFFDSFATHKNITLTTLINEGINVTIDEEKINNVLINLISNALKFTHPGGKITVFVQIDKISKKITVHVQDTGNGISETDLPQVFNRFYQVNSNGRAHQGGSGIGLALSLEYARLHGGNITVTSKEGEGSEFVLELPGSLLCENPNEQTQEIPSENVVRQNGSIFLRSEEKRNVLLVEDNPDMQQYICGYLEKDYHIVKAIDGLDALEKLKKFTPDLIISDVMMPRMNGLELASRLKESSKHKLTPFITLTARADERARLDALRIGIDDYMVKPFNPEELRTRVNNLIINYQERKAAIKEAVAAGNEDEVFSHEDKFINKLKEKVNEYIDDSSFSVKDLADFAAMSESTLHRTTKKTTGLTPGQFIREIRLQKALYLLENRKYATIAEVIYSVGFENKTHFSRLFESRFGKSPAAYTV